MSFGNEPYETADIRMSEILWSKNMKPAEIAAQQKHLTELAEHAKAGVILDCTFIEVANSELLNQLVRVRTHIKKQHKGFALFGVPENLAKTIKVCNLSSMLPIAKDLTDAKKMAYQMSKGKGGFAQTFKRMLGK